LLNNLSTVEELVFKMARIIETQVGDGLWSQGVQP
jgi:hypothetical protein